VAELFAMMLAACPNVIIMGDTDRKSVV